MFKNVNYLPLEIRIRPTNGAPNPPMCQFSLCVLDHGLVVWCDTSYTDYSFKYFIRL